MTPLIEAAGLSKHYPVRAGALLHRYTLPLRAVDDVALRIAAGETLGLVGESGSGKTTVARMILGLVQPTRGSVRVAGIDLSIRNCCDSV